LTKKAALYLPAGHPLKSSIFQNGNSSPKLLFTDSVVPDGPVTTTFAFRRFDPPTVKIRNGSPGLGFLGKHSISKARGFSSEATLSLPESIFPDETMPPFETVPLSHDDKQLKATGIIKLKISDRILIPAVFFKIGIFDLKIT
jgi:hypothetical protein